MRTLLKPTRTWPPFTGRVQKRQSAGLATPSRDRLFFGSIQLSNSIEALPSRFFPPHNPSRPSLSTRLGSDTYFKRTWTQLQSSLKLSKRLGRTMSSYCSRFFWIKSQTTRLRSFNLDG